MKNLKIRFGLFSLLAVLAVSVFLTSCEQDSILPDTIEVNTVELENALVYFTLPESFNNMSDDDLNNYFKNMQEEEVLNMAVEILENNIETRWCSPAVSTGFYYCSYSSGCYQRKRVLMRQYCEGAGNVFYFASGSCC